MKAVSSFGIFNLTDSVEIDYLAHGIFIMHLVLYLNWRGVLSSVFRSKISIIVYDLPNECNFHSWSVHAATPVRGTCWHQFYFTPVSILTAFSVACHLHYTCDIQLSLNETFVSAESIRAAAKS